MQEEGEVAKTSLQITFPSKKFLLAVTQEFKANGVHIIGDHGDENAALVHLSEALNDEEENGFEKVLEVVKFPIEFALAATMGWCDSKKPDKAHLWYMCFFVSMMWLAFFSWAMVTIADIIHADFGIPTALLGITLCAVGTSFPNFFASILMSKENRSAMAIANALGSNVQNVFLALALPWTVKTALDGPLAVAANGIFAGVLWMGGTLVLMFGMAFFRGFKLGMMDGTILITLYFVYLGFAILG